jgi:DNA modification methylase
VSVCPDLAKWLNKIVCDNCLAVLPKLPDNSIDLLLTDPPYGLNFMGKNWDKAVPSVAVWKECLRVLKPGAFAFIMSSPRSDCLGEMSRRLTEAGFRLDFSQIFWTFLNGFPKAENIAKAIDKRLGVQPEIIGERRQNGAKFKLIQREIDNGGFNDPDRTSFKITKPASKLAKALDGAFGGFQPKPAVEVIIVAMKPPNTKTWVDQALENGKGASWFGDCRIPLAQGENLEIRRNNKRKLDANNQGRGFKSGSRDNRGRFPANLLVSDDVLDDGVRSPSRHFSLDDWWKERIKKLPENVQKTFPFLSVPKPSPKEKNMGLDDMPEVVKSNLPLRDGSGNYVKNEYGDGSRSTRNTKTRNVHPTVKPLKLFSYLVTLGSRPGDVVLDTYLGSGTTAMACKMLGRNFIGIEINPEYCEIARKRLAAVTNLSHHV